MDNMVCPPQANRPVRPRYREGFPYPCITRPEGVLTPTMFAYIQRREAPQYLQAFVEGCWRRYVYSCKVAGIPDPSLEGGTLLPYLTPLLYPWDRLCCWYRDTVFERQLELFECPYKFELTRWRRLVLERCFEPIYDDPQRLRLTLANVGLIPAMYEDFELYQDTEGGVSEPIFGWVPDDHTRRAWVR